MPTYDYVCRACGHELEIFQAITESPKRKCPACKKPRLQRRLGAGAAILFKGSGFYQTDYRSEAYKSAEKAEKGETKAPEKPAESSSGSSDSKPKDGADAKPPTVRPPKGPHPKKKP